MGAERRGPRAFTARGSRMRPEGRGVIVSGVVRDTGPRIRISGQRRKGTSMAAMKPRTGDGPLEVTKEGRGIVMRVPLEGGGRLVVELSADEANALGEALKGVTG